MLVEDVMQRRVITVAEDDRLGLALQLMLWNDVRHIPVQRAADARVTGIVSERDVLRARLSPDGERALGMQVRDAMTSPVEHTHPKAELADAAALLATRKLGCLPVLDAGELVGILSVADVLGTIAQSPVERPEAAAPDGGTAASVMRADPLTCHEDDLLVAATARMASAGVRHLCVVDGERRVTGMLSDRDVRRSFGEPRAVLTRKPPARFGKLRVRQAWHAGARTVREDAPLTDVIDLLITTRVGAIPVVDREDRLSGIISYVDVLRQVAPEA